jgi:endonuclease/exonuclease/phosphatase family metal-dependent hydrolase
MTMRALLTMASVTLALTACRGQESSVSPGVGGAGAGTVVVGGAGPGSGGAGGSTSFPGQASLITWNIENFPLQPATVGEVASLVGQLQPALLAVQEIADEAAFQDLYGGMADYDGMLNDDAGAFLRLGLLYQTARVTVTDVETLFKSDSYAFPRPPLKAHVSIAGPEPFDFTVMILHLKAQLDTDSESRRRAAIQALAVWLQDELASGRDDDIVLMGDFNDELDDPPQWNVFGPLLVPQYQFLTLPLAEAGQYSYIPFQSMIDHVMVTSDALSEYGNGTTEVLELDQTMPGFADISDHRPVRATFRWSP